MVVINATVWVYTLMISNHSALPFPFSDFWSSHSTNSFMVNPLSLFHWGGEHHFPCILFIEIYSIHALRFFADLCYLSSIKKKNTSNFFFDISGRFWPWWSVWNGNPEVPWWMMRPESWGCVSHVATAMGCCRLNEVSGNGIELLVSQLLWENQSFFWGAKNLWR